MPNPSASIIISTYNQPKWLSLVLSGYLQQSFKDFEIIVADDGSTNDTKEVIRNFNSRFDDSIVHVWQEDEGFRKTTILNKAAMASRAEYLIFTDGDCIPRQDFVEKHMALKKEGHFLSGGYFKLSKEISDQITEDDIVGQRCFEARWLLQKGLKRTFKLQKLISSGFKEWFLNTFTTTKATWDGMNASGFKKDILSVNGFDERMKYGGEDREMGERLVNKGIKPVQIRYSAICVHLEHGRSYVHKEHTKINRNIRKDTKTQHKVWTDFGIAKR